MSLNKLVGGDCGGNNALVQLSSIVRSDATQPISQADRFVNEFMAQNSQAPQTFNMNALLHNLPEESAQKMSQPVLNTSITPQASIPWKAGPSTGFMPPHVMRHNMLMPVQPLSAFPQTSSNVQIQYISESELSTNDDVKVKAQEYVNNVKEDDELAYNQFMSFMKKISAGEMDLSEPSGSETKTGPQTFKTRDEILAEMTEKYQEEWAKLSDVSEHWTPREETEKYIFSENNIMLENKSALDIGKEKLKMGDIPGAALCFEAAVQQNENSAEAWFLLGMTQAENEQDPSAIAALKKSLQLDPHQLEAYLTLAAAYTNENMPKYALIQLINWLQVSEYGKMLPEATLNQTIKSMDIKEMETHVKTLFLKAAQLNASKIDPNVQNALGVFFNISQEYDKAVDCFKTALLVDNDNAKLWNRLGATLANSDRSEEAVEAYHQALNLEPGFIRARYNVGITCMNLGAHKQAAEHFLVALNQQYKAKDMFPEASATDISSSTIWTTLRMVVSFMGDYENTKLVDNRDLDALNKVFEIE